MNVLNIIDEFENKLLKDLLACIQPSDIFAIRASVKTVQTADFINKYRDVNRIEENCKACNNYGKSWLCPPIATELSNKLFDYGLISIIKITYNFLKPIRLTDLDDYLHDIRIALEDCVLRHEHLSNGWSYLFSGNCPRCKGMCCRTLNKPCKHKNLCRPSLEALGFDVIKASNDIFDTKMEWGKNGMAPSLLNQIGAMQWDIDYCNI